MLIEEKQIVASFMARAYEHGLTTSTGGNLSYRVGNVMLITPSGKDKGGLSWQDIAEVDIQTGENLTPEKKLSIETEMHRSIYLEREDAVSVMHSHPTYCCLYASSNEEINTKLIAESWYLLDTVTKIPYALMGTKELAEKVRGAVRNGKTAYLLENHGALAIGKSVINAFDRLECLEQAAKLTFLSHTVKAYEIKREELDKIESMR